ncbi:MAG TPA: class A beta-lactamase-related serine hydrolase, partial [Spirochaetes bacterium]|nr:class A beta-lactamase-related serine hydrolase [Spirochaetota bacterium]
GLIVEDVSGTDFSEYITKTVFTPLGMNDSSFDMPARLMERCAAGYEYRGDRQVRVPFDSLLQMAPAGSLISTPADMAKFMIMHLSPGGQGGRRVLSARSAAVIQRRHFSHHPAMDGVCYDFFESTLNSRRGLYHTGSWQGCSAMLYLIPGSDLGIFIAANARSHAFLFDLVREFHDRFFPEIYAAPAVKAGLPDSAALVSGSYRDIQYSRTTVEKIASLMGRVRVKKAGAGAIEIMFPSEGKNSSRWVQVDERLYQRTDRRELVFFDGAGSEPPSRMMKGAFVYERVGRHETAPVQAALFVLSLAFSAAVAMGLPLFVRRLRERKPGGDVLSAIPGHYLVIVTVNGWLSFVGLGGLLLSFVLMDPFVFTRGMPAIFTAFLAMLTLGALLTLAQGFYLMKLWKNVSDRPRWEWILPLITLLFVLNALFLSSWNLLGLKM